MTRPGTPSSETTPDHLRGLWLHWRDWHRYRDGGTHASQIAKPHWLALPRPEHLLALRELDAQLSAHFHRHTAPLQLALWHPDAGWQRIFVVAGGWPRQIPLPPRASDGVRPPTPGV